MRTRRSPRNQERLYKALGADMAAAAAAAEPAPAAEPKEPGPSLYDDVVRLGIPHHSHYSDLYLPKTQQVIDLLKQHGKTVDGWSVKSFRNQVEGGTWLDVAFSYDPYWRMKQLQKEVRTK